MAFLAVDTGSEPGGVALLDGDHLLAETSFRVRRLHAERLMPFISELLRGAGVDGEQLEGVAVTVGPGSFTGLRIGVTTAKTLAWAWGRPLVPVHSLDALAVQAASGLGLLEGGAAWNADGDGDGDLAWEGDRARGRNAAANAAPPVRLIPLIDARRGGVYTAVYHADRGAGSGGPAAAASLAPRAAGLPPEEMTAPEPTGASGTSGASGELSTVGRLPIPLVLESGPAVVPIDELADRLPGGGDAPVFLVGDGARKGWDALHRVRGRGGREGRVARSLPSGSDLRPLSVAQLGRMRLAWGESADPASLVPLYIRRPDAESNESEAGRFGSRGG